MVTFRESIDVEAFAGSGPAQDLMNATLGFAQAR